MIKPLILSLFSALLAISPTYGKESIPEGMVLIPKGLFQMGSKKSMLELRPHDLFNTDRHTLGPENPAHEVYLDDFHIDIYEVTNDAYEKYIKETPNFDVSEIKVKLFGEQKVWETKVLGMMCSDLDADGDGYLCSTELNKSFEVNTFLT